MNVSDSVVNLFEEISSIPLIDIAEIAAFMRALSDLFGFLVLNFQGLFLWLESRGIGSVHCLQTAIADSKQMMHRRYRSTNAGWMAYLTS